MRGLGWICAGTLGTATPWGASLSTAWAGSISGGVTDGSTVAPIQGIQVTAWREASANQWQGVAEFTDATDNHTIKALTTDSYVVRFDPPCPSTTSGSGYKAAELSNFAGICAAVPA